VTGAQAGAWFAPLRMGQVRTTHLTVNISLTLGTATWILEGRMNANDTPVQIDTGTASKSDVIASFNEYRFRLSAATGATVAARLNRPTQAVQ
jgi:hypothetical protein